MDYNQEKLLTCTPEAKHGKGAFRRFQDVLPNYLEERERWFQFKDDRIEERAREWLSDIDVGLIEG